MNILVVEDNDDDVLIVTSYLCKSKADNLAITTVDTLAKGIESLKQKNFDVVLLDLSLPDSQGLATFLKLVEYALHIPVIILTGLDDEKLGIDAVRSGAQDYLVKSQLMDRLFTRALHYAIERKRMQEEIGKKIEALQELNKIMMGREERILELKEELQTLKAKIAADESPAGKGLKK